MTRRAPNTHCRVVINHQSDSGCEETMFGKGGIPHALRSWWGPPPGLASQYNQQTKEEKKEAETGGTKKCFVLILPHPAPGCPGPLWIRAGNVCCGLGAAAWFTQKGRRGEGRAKSTSRPGRWAFVGWEGRFVIGLLVMLFVDGRQPLRGMWVEMARCVCVCVCVQ
jgi:hypothetical protein